MIKCLSDDYVKINFEYGKREEFAGATACFDHSMYKNAVTGNEDGIPFTPLDVCNQSSKDKQRCYLYGYSVSIFVKDVS